MPARHAAIKLISAIDEFFIDEGCHIKELSNTEDDAEVSIAHARVEPGVTTHWHRLVDTTERYVIIEGEGRVEIGDLEPTAVGPGDTVIIPPKCRQRITNTGDDDLVFLAICSPRFEHACYESLE